MTELARVPETVHERANELREGKDMTIGEAIRKMCRDGGYDV